MNVVAWELIDLRKSAHEVGEKITCIGMNQKTYDYIHEAPNFKEWEYLFDMKIEIVDSVKTYDIVLLGSERLWWWEERDKKWKRN